MTGGNHRNHSKMVSVFVAVQGNLITVRNCCNRHNRHCVMATLNEAAVDWSFAITAA